jgi:hypothetical protein
MCLDVEGYLKTSFQKLYDAKSVSCHREEGVWSQRFKRPP